jgi:hypothetical protein
MAVKTNKNLITEQGVKQRAGFTAKQLGSSVASMQFENYLFYFAQEMIDGYTGGYWNMVELSNGGFYWYLSEASGTLVTNNMNFSEERMLDRTAGLVLSTMALNHLMGYFDEKGMSDVVEKLVEKFEANMSYIRQLPKEEATKAYRILD